MGGIQGRFQGRCCGRSRSKIGQLGLLLSLGCIVFVASKPTFTGAAVGQERVYIDEKSPAIECLLSGFLKIMLALVSVADGGGKAAYEIFL